ncbi:MAG: endonuclease III [Thermodesulfobacteriota bacterium]
MQHSDLKPLKSKVKKIVHLLEREYGIPRRKRGGDPLDILIQTILSQNTNDRNRDRAYERLRTRFPHWEGVLRAKTEAVVSAIRPGGLAKQKAGHIRNLLRWIKRHYGNLSLSSLQGMDSEEIKRRIGGLKGVGPKTVHCFLLFGIGREAFPVDTHILRVGNRLGFIPEGMGAEEAHRWMVPLVPKGKSLSFHLNLIRFGREICKAKNPQCENCFLGNECIYFSPCLRQAGLPLPLDE